MVLLLAAALQGWEPVAVPGTRAVEGVSWYRTWVLPDAGFFTPHERNLFEESVSITMRDVADSHDLFVNGKKIASGVRGGNNRHKVPAGTLVKGRWNEIAVRVSTRAGPGGFAGEAPFIMNYFMECVLEGTWEFRKGDDPAWAGPALVDRPASSSFRDFHESNRMLGEAAELVHGPKRPPDESFKLMKPHAEFRVELLLHEPLVAQPVHVSFDERGRMWVSQYRQYPYPAGLKMISRDKYYRAHYDKVPPPPPNHDRGRDVVSIHEDSDGDGTYDRHSVFQDGLNMANAAVAGWGGVWIMQTPYLLFYPGAGGPPEVRLAGFGLEDTHSTANGLVWGMDGWLYGGQGSTTSSRVTRPGIDAPAVAYEGCMVWRYHPKARVYEIFAEGTGNVFGLEVDAEGRLFSGHNGGATRGWHYVQNGVYLKQGVDPGKFGPPRNPFAFGELPMLRTRDSIVRFSHQFAMGEGTALPSTFRGMLLSVDPLHNTVIASRRKALGATFETEDVGPVLTGGDAAFRPVFIVNAPDGSIVVADFYEHYIAHGQHYQSNIDPTTGRIYRLRGKDAPLERDVRLDKKSSAELVALLAHPNKWHRHTAVRLLGERRDPAAVGPLKAALAGDAGLEALWALVQAGAMDDESWARALAHPKAAVRTWSVRLMGDGGRITPAVLEMARREPDAEVRAQMASTARRLPPGEALPLVAALLSRDEDLADPYIPLLCWWVLEQNMAEATVLFRDKALWERPMVVEHILPRLMRRLAAEGRRADLLECAALLRAAPSPTHTKALMKGFEEAYRGRAMTGLPDELVSAIAAAGNSSLMLRLRQGQVPAVEEALTIVRNPKSPERLLYIRAFGELHPPAAAPVLLEIASAEGDLTIRRAAFVSLSAYNDPEIGRKLIALLPGLPTDARGAALSALASRPAWSTTLLAAFDAGLKLDVPAEVAERLRMHPDPAARERAVKRFPPPADAGAARERIAKVEAVLQAGTGNPYAGEPIFMNRCGACHTLFFKGGAVGPDLTRYQRDTLATLLPSIVTPSAEIREGFAYVAIETADDRMLAGYIVERDAKVTVLRGVDGQDVTLPQTEIKELRPMGRSLMPDGLLDGLTDQALRDLFAYLRISQPITR